MNIDDYRGDEPPFYLLFLWQPAREGYELAGGGLDATELIARAHRGLMRGRRFAYVVQVVYAASDLKGESMTDEFILAVRLKPGVCRWCGCTERDPCPGGCGWADRQQTLCTSCSHFNKAIQTATGRKQIAQRLLEA